MYDTYRTISNVCHRVKLISPLMLEVDYDLGANAVRFVRELKTQLNYIEDGLFGREVTLEFFPLSMLEVSENSVHTDIGSNIK